MYITCTACTALSHSLALSSKLWKPIPVNMNRPGQVPVGNQPVSLPPSGGISPGPPGGDCPPFLPPHGLPPPLHGTSRPPILPPPGLPPSSLPGNHPFQGGGGDGISQGLSPRGNESPGHAPQMDKPGDEGGGVMLMRQSSQDGSSPSSQTNMPMHPHGPGGFPNVPPGHIARNVPPRAGLLPPPGPPMNAGLPPAPGELNRPPMFGGPRMPHAEFSRPPRPGGATPPSGTPSGEVGRPPGMGEPPGLNRPPGPNEIRPPHPSGAPPTANRPPGDIRPLGPCPPGDPNRPPGPSPGEVRPPHMGPPRPSMDSSGPRYSGPPGFPPMNRPPGGFPNEPRPLMKGPPFRFPHGPPPGGDFPPGGGEQEVWFEHVTAEGKVYFSNAQTQKTTWDRPQNAHILPPGTPPTGPRIVPDKGIRPPLFPPGFPPPSLPGNPQLVPTRVWSDHQTPEGKVYYYNKVTKQSVWEQPKDYELIMPLPLSFSTPAPVEQKTVVSEQGDSNETKVEKGAGEEGTVPEGGVAPNSVLDGGDQDQANEVEMVQSTEESPTTNPASIGPPNPSMGAPMGVPGLTRNQPPHFAPQNFPPSAPPFAPPTSHLQPTPPPHLPMPLPAPAPLSALETPIPASVLSLTPAPVKPGPRPVVSSPVSGTPWSVVWTTDDRKFFFNATNHSSVWSVPSELIGNQDVERLLDNPPGGKKRVGGSRDGPDAKRLRLSDSENSDEEEEEEEVEEMEGVAVVSGDSRTGPSAELKAAQARASKPLEERQRIFKDMLLERGVSAFSTWEKELPKFVFDPRYLLLTQKERKACFQAFIRSRTEEERRERKNQLKEMKEKFRSLLEGARLHPKSNFSEFASKYGKDERFKAVEKMREREQMFTDFLVELKKRGSSKQREEHKVPSTKSKTEKVRDDFLAMLTESHQVFEEHAQWKKVKGSFDQDPRYKAVESSTKREELFKEHIKGLKDNTQEVANPEQTREERIQASLKEREREVQMSRSAQEKEWGRERDQLKKMEAQQQFKALLVDVVKLPQIQWHDAKRNLKRDQRWEVTRLLDHSEREQMFQDHVLELANRRRLHFRKLLEETAQITLDMPWKKARKLIREDARYKNFTDSDYKREVEFDKYQSDKLVMAKNEFHSLLKETKFITYKSYDLVRESDRHLKDIVNLLKNDKRYLVLECVPKDRDGILDDFLEELHRRGPPPPPTATNPGERLKRPAPL